MSISRTFFVALLIFFWTSSGNGLFAQNAWESLPVFHNGRVMPLHTFAQQTVRDICGTTRPYIVWDDAVIAEFNQVIEFLQRANDIEHEETSDQFRFLAPSDGLLDGGFKREYSLFEIEKDVPQAPVDVSTKGLDRLQIDRLANRVRQLVTPEGRYFSADEILLSWICEPQVWTYIPIFLVPETDYLEEMFGISFENDARTSQYRVSLYQLEKSSRYKQRCADIQRRLELGQKTRNPVRFDQITERLQNQVRLFRELTFHPSRQRPERMLSLLSQSAGMSHDQSLYASAFEMWSYLLSLGEASGRQVTDRASLTSASAVFHPTTQRWHVIADKLQLLMKAYQRTDEGGNEVLPNPLMIEEQFEELVSLLDTNLAESAALMESIYPDVSYQTGNSTQKVDAAALLPRLQTNENQQNQEAVHRIIISYYYSVKKFRNEIEAAYLALYDNGLALRMLPIHSSLSLESIDAQGHLGVLPWASSQMILGSGEMFVKRFFDPELKVSSVLTLPTQPQEESNSTFDISEDDTDNTIADDTDNAVSDNSSGDPSTTATEEKNVLPSTPASESANRSTQADQEATSDQSEEELLFLPFHMEGGIFPMDLGNQNTIIGSLRNNIRLFLVSYSSTGGEYGTSDFIFRVQQIQQACQQAAVRIEANRKSLINEEKDNEHLTKTAYPVTTRKLSAEYRYDRLNPFYWMWLCALLAVLCNGCAYIAAVTRSKSAVAQTITIHSIGRSGKKEETELQDYTNSLEEWLFFGSVVLLMGAIFIAFLGGVMRAAITGWAPITNMYETVVMTAFAAALIGIWYALHPLLHPALQLAWVYSQFPSFGTLREWFGAKREHQSVRTHKETAGEAAMREAAIEFGVPEGVTIGEHSPMPILTEEVIEAQQHVIIAQRKVFGQCLMSIPRLLLTLAVFYVIVLLANGEYAAEYGFIAAAENMFVTSDVIDVLVVAASVFLMVWLIPHFIVMLCLIPIILLRPSWIAAEKGIRSFEVAMIVEGAKHPSNVPLSAHTTGLTHSEMSGVFHGEANFRKSKEISGAAWIKQARNALLDRKLFLMITAAVVFIVGLTANLNRVEFNPDIRPIAAVLRSNFWLTVHVIAIVISYAAAFIAWGMSLISLGYVIFGRFQRDTLQGQKMVIRLPATCQMFSPVIERLLRIALLLLVIGTVLGARWADYSWGRFWSWDPKEVWALITILFYAIVFHGRIARYYGTIGITVGALLASIAVIITWYGINFVFKGSVHSYGGGTDSNAMLFLGTFIAANVLWGALALLRYCAEVYGSDNEPQMT